MSGDIGAALGKIAIVVACFGCGGTSAPMTRTPEVPVQRADGWNVGSLADHGLDPIRIGLLEQEIVNGDLEEIHALVIARHGYLVYERYFLPYTGIDSLHVLNSVTKSVVSMLTGIAVRDGLLAGPDQPVADLFPEAADIFAAEPAKRDIVVSDVLTMSAGLEWETRDPSDPNTLSRQLMHTADPVRFVLARPLVAEPGTRFLYSEGLATLMSAAITNVSGVHADAFAAEHLFAPLGITAFDWQHLDAGPAIGGYGLRLTARDLAKLGQLMLQEGEWNGARILPTEWIGASMSPAIASNEALTWYGFMWWLSGLPAADGSIDARNDLWLGSGYGGQKLFVIPDLDLLVVFYGCSGTYECGISDQVPQLALYNYILKAVATD